MTSDGWTSKTRVLPLVIFHSQLWGVLKPPVQICLCIIQVGIVSKAQGAVVTNILHPTFEEIQASSRPHGPVK